MAIDVTAAATRPAALRRRVPWTQRELATAAGVSPGTIRALEQGSPRRPRPRVIRALAAALGVPPAAVAEFRPALGLPPAAAGASHHACPMQPARGRAPPAPPEPPAPLGPPPAAANLRGRLS